MEPIVAKRQADDTPVPVIGIEPTLKSASRELISSEIEGDDKLSRIAVLAYYKAEARGYEPGHEKQDWLDAEAEIMDKTREGKIK